MVLISGPVIAGRLDRSIVGLGCGSQLLNDSKSGR
jgi:hypothetical protein